MQDPDHIHSHRFVVGSPFFNLLLGNRGALDLENNIGCLPNDISDSGNSRERALEGTLPFWQKVEQLKLGLEVFCAFLMLSAMGFAFDVEIVGLPMGAAAKAHGPFAFGAFVVFMLFGILCQNRGAAIDGKELHTNCWMTWSFPNNYSSVIYIIPTKK